MTSGLQVWIDSPVDGDAQRDALARQLGAELRELPVRRVEPLALGDAPPGTRGPDAFAVGALLVTLAPQFQALNAIVGVVADWCRRVAINRPGTPAPTVRLELNGDVIEVTGASAGTVALQEELARLWIERHSRAAP